MIVCIVYHHQVALYFIGEDDEWDTFTVISTERPTRQLIESEDSRSGFVNDGFTCKHRIVFLTKASIL